MKLYAAAYILISCLFFSCKTTKFIEKEKVVIDSTAIKQRDALARVLKEEVERFEKEREEWESTGVTFETTPCPDSATKTVTKIVFDNGKIKSIEGNVKALNQSLYEKQAEVYDAHLLVDSLMLENERLETALSKKEVKVVREIERTTYIPIWMWVILGISGFVAIYPHSKKLINKIKSYVKKSNT